MIRALTLALAVALLGGCLGLRHPPPVAPSQPRQAPDAAGNNRAKTAPYEVFGQVYYPIDDAFGYRERGVASWYGGKFHGRNTANGERYDMHRFTAAHKTLPLPTWVRVTNLRNGSSVTVRVNDRGPFVKNRLIDLSYAAARQLGMVEDGTTLVEVEALSAAPEAPSLAAAAAPDIAPAALPAPITAPAVAADTPPAPAPSASGAADSARPTTGGLTPVAVAAAPEPPAAVTPEPAAAKPEPAAATPGPAAATPEPAAATPGPTAATPERTAATPERPAATPERTAATAPPASRPDVQPVDIYVQVGAFGDRANAERVRTTLYNAGIADVRLGAGDIDGLPVHRVQIGPVRGVVEYDALIAQLGSLGIHNTHLITEFLID